VKPTRWRLAAVVVCAALAAAFVWWRLGPGSGARWRPKNAAMYLDRREAEWANWQPASRGNGTFCASCHTAVPYALARPVLRATLGETTPSAAERQLLDDVTRRVRNWNDNQLYYGGIADQSRGTEAVINALILSSRDSRTDQLSADTRAAFSHMWETQQTTGNDKGAWLWIQFDNEPWEAPDSLYYGACLAAAAVGMAPQSYGAEPEIQENLKSLRDYLTGESATQSPLNRLNLLWASTMLPGLLSAAEQKAILDEAVAKQRPDGGWSLSSFMGTWRREDGTPLVADSDGYATGFVVYVMEQMGIPREDARVQRGLSWLRRNQEIWEGQWLGHSPNRRRHNPFSMVARFMDDAATAYAVLALTNQSRSSSHTAVVEQRRSPSDAFKTVSTVSR